METKKIAKACFIGGAVCSAVAMLVNPAFWWFGLLAGLAAGYLSYELREVREKIPLAWRKVKRGSVDILMELIEVVFICGLILGFPIWFPILIFALVGSRVGEKCFWRPMVFAEERKRVLEERGFKEKPFIFRNVVRWTLKGIGISILKSPCFLGRFAWHLVKLIHSQERVLCAIDGTLGGAISYGLFSWLHSGSVPLADYAMFVVFGGLIGAAIGVANYEIVSKRVLRVAASVEK